MTIELQRVVRRATAVEAVYRENVRGITAFFARRSEDPQTVADLTQETFARVIDGWESFDSRRGTARAWTFGIARHVFAEHCELRASRREAARRRIGWRELDDDETDELLERIDAERAGHRLLERCAALPELERGAIELVDLDGLRPAEAARALGVSAGTLRIRLFRARARLRLKEE